MLMTLMTWNGYDGPGAWWPIFPIFWLLLITGVVVAFTIFWRRRRTPDPAAAGAAQLAERFARGEIDEQEYRDRLSVLRQE